MAIEKKEVKVRLNEKWCLPVIKWYKKHVLKQVLQATYTLDKTFFAAATFEDLWVKSFRAYLKVYFGLYESSSHFYRR